MASMFGWGADPFAELVDKATSELLPAGQEDIALNLEICDQVRAKQVQPKQAMQAIKRRISHKNPNVVLLALGLTDICIKNGGDHFIAEVASREFMDNLVSILQNPAGVNADVKTKALKLIQNWAQISEAKPQQMSYMQEAYRTLKTSGFDFPAEDRQVIASGAFVETMTAPEWVESDVCMRCRTTFTTFNRKHHCRNCGQVFCGDCSSKQMSLPWYGIGQEVRVCEACYTKKAPAKKSATTASLPAGSSRQTMTTPSGRRAYSAKHALPPSKERSDRRKKEEDDMALAIKLSLESSSDAGPSRPGFVASAPVAREGRPTRQADGRMMEGTDADDDPELAAAIAASLREYAPPAPSAPSEEGARTPRFYDASNGQRQANETYATNSETRLPLPPSLDLPASDVDALLTFSQEAGRQEEYARQYGQWSNNYGARQQTQEAYERATVVRPRVAKTLDEATRRHGVLNSMHDKLSEAVRLYDKHLDAQMQRPSYTAYGEPSAAQRYDPYLEDSRRQQQQPQQQQQPHWSPQHRYSSGMDRPMPVTAPQALSAESELYPSLPSQQLNYQPTNSSQWNDQPQYTDSSYNSVGSPMPYFGHTQNAAMYGHVGQMPFTAAGGSGTESHHATQGYGSPQGLPGTQWQPDQGMYYAPREGSAYGPEAIGSPPQSALQRIPSNASKPLHDSMSSLAIGHQLGESKANATNSAAQVQQRESAILSPKMNPTGSAHPHTGESYDSGWASNPSTQASGPGSIRQSSHSIDATMPQSAQAQASPAELREQQLAALPSPGKFGLAVPPGANGDAAVGTSTNAPPSISYAMPPPPPQGFPSLSSPREQHNDRVWSRPVETPLIDL